MYLPVLCLYSWQRKAFTRFQSCEQAWTRRVCLGFSVFFHNQATYTIVVNKAHFSIVQRKNRIIMGYVIPLKQLPHLSFDVCFMIVLCICLLKKRLDFFQTCDVLALLIFLFYFFRNVNLLMHKRKRTHTPNFISNNVDWEDICGSAFEMWDCKTGFFWIFLRLDAV